MATAVKRKLSQSTNGRGIKITTTGTAGTALHTVVAGTTDGSYDEVWLMAYNSDVTDRLVTVEFGGTTAPDDTFAVTIPAKETLPLCRGLILQNGLSIAVFADAVNVVSVFGYVNRMTD